MKKKNIYIYIYTENFETTKKVIFDQFFPFKSKTDLDIRKTIKMTKEWHCTDIQHSISTSQPFERQINDSNIKLSPIIDIC